MYINQKNWEELTIDFLSAKPFNHLVLDNFFTNEIAEKIVEEFPQGYEHPSWSAHYSNPIENKKTCNHWDQFPPTTYQVFRYLCSSEFETIVETVTGNKKVIADIGLHGGGWHSHTTSGNLNIHLDYEIHPKLYLQRHFNLIVYITPNWNSHWGGGLEFWSHDNKTNKPDKCITTVENRFNRAVIFDTTQNSWHGLPEKLNCPEGVMRQSLAIYYLTEPTISLESRNKALFAPYKDQINDPKVLDLIKLRSQNTTAKEVYRTK